MKIKQAKIFAPLVMFGVILAVLIYLYHDANINYAMVSSSNQADVKYLEYTIKNTDEFGWFFENSRTDGGAGELYEHSMGDFVQYSLVLIISIFTDNFDLIYNIFYFLTYFVCAGVMYGVARALKLSRPVSAMMGLLFTFLPWHQLRMHHLMSSTFYAAVPVAILVSIWIAEGEIESGKKWRLGKIELDSKYALICFLTLLSSITDVIWSAFNCYVLAIAIIIAAFRNKNIKSIIKNIFVLVIEFVGTLMMYLPAFIHYWQVGANSGAAAFNRNPREAEVYGMKIFCLFLPRSNHNIQAFADMNEIYQNHLGVNENAYTSLGLIVCVAFVLLTVSLFFNKKEKRNETLSLLNIGVILIATVGGVGAIVAYMIPQIRTYNRMSIYIAGFSIIYLGTLLDKKWTAIEGRARKIFMTCCICGLLAALYDCTVVYEQSDQSEIIAETDSTRAFVEDIEDVMPEGSKIYQIPYAPLPEAGYYDMLDGYLYSDNLIWSFGSRNGTDHDLWQKELQELSVEQLCEQIVTEGYTGLYVDLSYLRTSKYDSNGTFIQDMNLVLQDKPVYSADQNLCFYDLRTWAESYLDGKSQEDLDCNRIPTREYTSGFSDEYTDGDGKPFRWCDGSGVITIHNRSSVERIVEVSFYADSYADEDNLLTIQANGETEEYTISGDHAENAESLISFSVNLAPGENELIFESSLEPIGKPKGIIEATFYIKDFRIIAE